MISFTKQYDYNIIESFIRRLWEKKFTLSPWTFISLIFVWYCHTAQLSYSLKQNANLEKVQQHLREFIRSVKLSSASIGCFILSALIVGHVIYAFVLFSQRYIISCNIWINRYVYNEKWCNSDCTQHHQSTFPCISTRWIASIAFIG